MLHAFLNLHKPVGMTAHDCIGKVRKLVQQKRVGHSGTLDPAATGVLPIALGQATRLLRFLPEGKAYNAKVRFGIITTTDDLEGEAIATESCPNLSLAEVEKLLPLFIGEIQQRPPAFSAIQVNGVRLYDLARAGKSVEAPIRTVNIREIKVLGWQAGDFPELDLAIACGSGTYIRAIARDLGAKLGCGATLAGLERTYSNGFDLANSLTFVDLESHLQNPNGINASFLVTPDVALQNLGAIYLLPTIAKRWTQGQIINIEQLEQLYEAGDYRVYDTDGRFWGIGQMQGSNLIPIVVLTEISQ